ncbi:MAG: ImmA/IrrE family metallo-endopeptidase [Chloroflexota bacterium]|nr:ImmA/IrrE family metallo-endopeptidase [Chloroflexota bacterium]
MNRAQRKAVQLRRKLGLHGRVDAEEVANLLGLVVQPWPLKVQEEMLMGHFISVAERLDSRWRRWVIAHAIGHKLLHPGNHLWIRDHTSLGSLFEREAEDFARALLLDAGEAMGEGLTEVWEVAEHFGVPNEMVQLQAPMRME